MIVATVASSYLKPAVLVLDHYESLNPILLLFGLVGLLTTWLQSVSI